MTMDLYIDEKDKELGRARLSQGGEGASDGERGGEAAGGGGRARGVWALAGGANLTYVGLTHVELQSFWFLLFET